MSGPIVECIHRRSDQVGETIEFTARNVSWDNLLASLDAAVERHCRTLKHYVHSDHESGCHEVTDTGRKTPVHHIYFLRLKHGEPCPGCRGQGWLDVRVMGGAAVVDNTVCPLCDGAGFIPVEAEDDLTVEVDA